MQRNEDILKQIDEKIKELHELKAELQDDAVFEPKKLHEIETEPTEIVCRDFLPLIKGAYNVISGSGGVGKSTIAMRSVLHYLRANPLKNAFMVMSEDDKEENESRLEYLAKNTLYSTDAEVADYKDRIFFVTSDNPISMRFLERSGGAATVNNALVRSVEEYIKNNNIGFVVFDPLKKFHACNENDNSEMDLLVRDVFAAMAGKLNIVLLVLHHSAKSSDAKGARGASTITDTARIAYKIAKKYKRDKESGELREDEDFIGKVHVSTIKDNKNIFFKFGRKNTANGIIELYPGTVNVEFETVEMPEVAI